MITLDDLVPSILGGKLFCFDHTDGRPLVVDYTSLDKELILSEDFFIEVGDKKEREIIESLDDFKKKVRALTIRTVQARSRHYLPPITIENIEFVVDQIIVDILFNMYCVSLEKLTLNQYVVKLCKTLSKTSTQDITATRKLMERGIKEEAKLYDNDTYRARLVKLGRNPDIEKKYVGLLNDPFKQEKKKNKLQWDYFYYNYNSKLLTSKQYKRSFSRDCKNSNDRYTKFIDDLIAYDDFIAKLLPTDNASDKEYFERSMDYYYLERYKRFDFMYKLAIKMNDLDFSKINRDHFLLKSFHPKVVCLSINCEENPLNLKEINKPYAPLVIFENSLLENALLVDDEELNSLYDDLLNALCNIRAITYELFIYHYEFAPHGYAEVADFMRNHYPIVNLHEPNKIWKEVEKTGWYDADTATRQKIKRIINHMERINDDALFWESAVRKRPRRRK